MLDLHFWVHAQRRGLKVNPKSVDDLVSCIKRFAEGYISETINKTCSNVLMPTRLRFEADGGHLQHDVAET